MYFFKLLAIYGILETLSNNENSHIYYDK